MGNASCRGFDPTVHVVVAGAGCAGIAVAQALDPYVRVTLVHDADSYYLNLAAPRALVSGAAFAARTMIPYTKVLRNGALLQAEVLEVRRDTLLVWSTLPPHAGGGSQQVLAFDYCVIATGSSYRAPIKAVSHAAHDTVAALDIAHMALRRAASVVIVGGGPVGCELAGEVKSAFPRAAVTLLHSGPALLSGQRNMAGGVPHAPALAERLAARLRALGVVVALGERVIEPAAAVTAAGAAVLTEHTAVRTASGKVFDADVVLVAHGGRPNSAPLARTLPEALTPDGHVRVTATLNVEGEARLFAIGDVAATGDAKQAAPTRAQAAHVARAILAVTRGAPAPLYRVQGNVMLVPLGRKDGVGAVGAWMCGGFAVAQIKGGDYFVGRYRRQMHAK